jgi:outer membrane protein assembly factor BamD
LNILKTLLNGLIIAFILIGCSSKQEEEYNKPALYWYNKMLSHISIGELDLADEVFTSLESEHRRSPLLPSAMMLLANAHMEDEEYQMARYYYDEYIKRFDNGSLNEYVKYLKIKAKFLAFRDQFREQKLIFNTISEIELYKKEFPNSSYIYLINTMEARLYMAQATLDLEISSLYDRVDKPQAALVYKEKAQKSWPNTDTIEPVDVPWYRAIFE